MVKLENIKIGQKYKVTGSIGECWANKKCKDCSPFKEGVVAEKINPGHDTYSNRIVFCKGITGGQCHFNPLDLEPFNKKLFDLEIK